MPKNTTQQLGQVLNPGLLTWSLAQHTNHLANASPTYGDRVWGKEKVPCSYYTKDSKEWLCFMGRLLFLIQSYECLAKWINLLAAQLIIFRSPRSHRYMCSAIVSSDWTDTMLLTCSVVVHCVWQANGGIKMKVSVIDSLNIWYPSHNAEI